MSIKLRTFFWMLLAIILQLAAPAHSETRICPDCQSLNQKFGPSWSCKMISAELDPLYRSCRVCEIKDLEFVQLSKDKGECGDRKGSLRGKIDEMLGKEPSVAPDIAAQEERQRRIEAETNDREAAIQKKMREDRMRRTRESDVSGSASGSSRAPTDSNADQMNKLLGEMSGMEAHQKQLKDRLDSKEIARREEAFRQEELRGTEAETRAYEESQRRAREAQSEFGPNVAVFKISNSYKYLVHVRFYSQKRSHEWPGNGQVWVMDDSKSHTFRLACETGEQICFGAWAPPNANPYWGVGTSKREGCQGCCIVCGGSSAFATNLVYNGPDPQTAGAGSSGGGGSNSAAEVIGAAAGIAAFAAGLAAGGSGGGGGGTTYRAAPNYQYGPPMRNRESGVSGGR